MSCAVTGWALPIRITREMLTKHSQENVLFVSPEALQSEREHNMNI